MKVDLPYLMQDVDRHGNLRSYVRKKGKPKIRIRATVGTPEFSAQYEAALRKLNADAASLAPQGPALRTLGWLVNEYEHSYEFKKLAPREQRVRHLILESCLDEATKPGTQYRFRDCPLEKFDADHVRLMRDRKKDKPGAANNRVSALRVVFSWGCEERSKIVKRDIAADVKPLKYASKGFHSWTREEVAQFENRHPMGSKPRLALAILSFTGMRRSDAVLLGPHHIKDGWIAFTPKKTSLTTGRKLELPVLKVLQDVLDITPLGKVAFLETSRGVPFTSNGFGNWFRDRCNEAGLPHCTAHGLRKAGADIAAENGATEKQMMAIFGWETARMAALYAKKASQKKLAGDAMHLLVPTAFSSKMPHSEG
jgi:integrase